MSFSERKKEVCGKTVRNKDDIFCPTHNKGIVKIKPKDFKLRKNKFGFFEHMQTHLVFDPKTKAVIGIQLYNGTIEPTLNKVDVDNCVLYSFKYIENLEERKIKIKELCQITKHLVKDTVIEQHLDKDKEANHQVEINSK